MSSAPKRTIRVIGAGPTALAVAARAAKLGHSVHLLDPEPGAIGPGGSLRPERRSLAPGDLAAADLTPGDLAPGDLAPGDFVWDGPEATFLLPAALRDLFRKSGRPLEAVLDLEPVITEHRFADGSSLRLPGGSRAAQLRAVAELSPDPVSGAELGRAWCDFVAGAARDGELALPAAEGAQIEALTAEVARARASLEWKAAGAERPLDGSAVAARVGLGRLAEGGGPSAIGACPQGVEEDEEPIDRVRGRLRPRLPCRIEPPFR